jgi:hypothetical protein
MRRRGYRRYGVADNDWGSFISPPGQAPDLLVQDMHECFAGWQHIVVPQHCCWAGAGSSRYRDMRTHYRIPPAFPGR